MYWQPPQPQSIIAVPLSENSNNTDLALISGCFNNPRTHSQICNNNNNNTKQNLSGLLHISKYTAKRKGFSLIELLVSISVLLILVGIILPALHSAMRGSATLVRCSMNLSQINIALQGYMNDNQSVLPTANYQPFAKSRKRIPLNVTLRKYFSNYKGTEINSPDNDILYWICAADPIKEIRINPRSLSSSYVYPLGKAMYDSVKPKIWLLRTTFPLLADGNPYHLDRYEGYQAPLIMIPTRKKDINTPQWGFDFPAGHNRLRVDGSITPGTNTKKNKP